MELTIAPFISEKSDAPYIILGFSNKEFSQCVYLRCSEDPLEVVAMANAIHEQLVNAAGEAVLAYKTRKGTVSTKTTFKGRKS